MPIYCYTSETGETIEEIFPMGGAPEAVTLQAQVYERDFAAERSSRPANSGWPMTCYASGVQAGQAGELREFFKEKGIRCEVTKGGDPVYTSKAHRTKCLRARNFHDRNSFD